MNVWLPGLIVVAVGLAAGLWFALRSRPDAASATPSPADPASPAPAVAAVPTPSPATPAAVRRARIVGFVFGVATSLVIFALVHWATTGARPRPEESAGAPMSPAPPMQPLPTAESATPAAADRAHSESADLAPEVRARLAGLRAQVGANPQDLNARRELAVALLNANQLMEAFEQARELQKAVPDDPDGLFVEGVVRLAMGQWPQSVGLMDRVLAQHPDHVLASLAKGQAQAAQGQTAEALATWRLGLAAAGGRFPPIEELIAEVEAGGEGAPRRAPASTPSPATEAGPRYRVHIELAPGAAVPTSADGRPATLFVALRGSAPGPPAAVKRIDAPTFPLDVVLSADDSMMGQPLPDKGSLSVHLDRDGNASTRDAEDLSAAVEVASGVEATVRLARGAPEGN